MATSVSRPVSKLPTVVEVEQNYTGTTEYLLAALHTLQGQLEKQLEDAAISKLQQLKNVAVLETRLSEALQGLEKRSDELKKLNTKLGELTKEVSELKKRDGRNAQKLQLLTIEVDKLTEQMQLTEQLVELFKSQVKTVDAANQILQKETTKLTQEKKRAEQTAAERYQEIRRRDPHWKRKDERTLADMERNQARARGLLKAKGDVATWFVNAFHDTEAYFVGVGRNLQDVFDPKEKVPLKEDT
jgi:chromosome segregation ATPase